MSGTSQREGRATALPPPTVQMAGTLRGSYLNVFPLIPVLRVDSPSTHFWRKEVRSLDLEGPVLREARALRVVSTLPAPNILVAQMLGSTEVFLQPELVKRQLGVGLATEESPGSLVHLPRADPGRLKKGQH